VKFAEKGLTKMRVYGKIFVYDAPERFLSLIYDISI